MRALKWAGALLGGALLLAGGGVVALAYALDAGALTPRIVAAIEAATGRAATLGRVSIGLGLTPRVTIADATLANLPGGARPEMARIRRIDASLALLPLLRGDIAFRAIAIEGADILLEQRPDGTPNWAFQPAPRDAAQPSPTAPPVAAAPPRQRLAIGVVTIADSRVTLPDPRLGTIAVQTARLQGLGGGGAETITARLVVHGLTLALVGEVPADAAAPMRATLAAGGNRLSAQGRPGAGIAFEATMPDYPALRPLFATLAPDAPLPASLPEITASLRLGPDLRPLGGTLRAGAADLAAIRPGLRLARLDLAVPGLDQPAEATVEASQNGLPVTATLNLDRPGALLPWAAETPVAVTLRAEAAGARAEATGRIQRPQAMQAAAFDIRLAVPDMPALAPILPGAPPVREATLAARITAPGSLRGPLRIETLRIAAPALAAEGAFTLTPGRTLGIDGRLQAERIDLDALTQRTPAAAPAPSAPAPAAAPPAAPAPAAEPGEPRIIPDIALPLAGLASWHGRIDLRAALLRIDGMDWRDLHATIAQDQDVLRVAPLTVASPGGVLQGEARIDRRANPPAFALALRSAGRGIDLAALRRARGEAPSLEGQAQIAIDVTARGTTTRALAASLSGDAGFAMVDGRLAGAGLLRLGPELVALLLPGAPRDGLALRCLALRIGAEDGIATTSALLAETSAGQLGGTAAVNLRTERLAARLLPDVQLLGVSVRAPVGVGGTLAAPRIGVDAGRAAAQVAGDALAGRLLRRDPAGDCAEQLHLARMGAEGPEPPPAAPRQGAVPGVPRDLQGPAQDLLRGLFGGQRR